MMRITLRLVLSLVFAASVVVAVSTYVQVTSERERLLEDLHRRTEVLADTLVDVVAPALAAEDKKRLSRAVSKYGNRGRLMGIAVFDAKGEMLASTPSLNPADLSAAGPLVSQALSEGAPAYRLVTERYLFLAPVPAESGGAGGAVGLFRDASYVRAKLEGIRNESFLRLFIHAMLISLVTLFVIRWNVLAPIDQLAEWMRQLRAGGTAELPPVSPGLLGPLASEAASLAKSLSAARASAEEEARLRQQGQSLWTPERLKKHVQEKLEGRPLFVVANREPYMHVRQGKGVRVLVPASGLVTGVEPVLRACGGTWVGHGAGDADRETADEKSRLPVPPGEPQYTLKRVWLTKEEEEGYYYGFSNEGLWPLCHIAHTRPIFREKDWQHYQSANRKFADALLEELEGTSEPCVLVQDYHFALLPRLIKQKRPDARVALFWHIPWPNPEAFGICPWQRALLEGMLGADLIGFHIQFHCNNFLETVDRTLESRIDWERFAVQRAGHATLVKPFPISIALPDQGRARPEGPSKEVLLRDLGVKADLLGVGVDRVDYTKGIAERFRGVERFLEKNPSYQGRFVFVELGAPSRTHIKRYQDHMTEVEAEADRINWRFKTKDYQPIVFLKGHHSHEEIDPYYRAADVCMVTSLADGMNLVAKEYVAAREDERGALILSRFTGAARELRDALIVNPYDTGQVADALRYALEMGPEEQNRRMASMRRVIKEQNIYFWASRLIDELSSIRLPARKTPA